MAEEVKLFGMWLSPFGRRIELALKLKGVQFEYIEEDLSNKSPELLKYNPIHRKIPVLVHNGKSVAESLVILEYIDETWKHQYPILPADPYEKARARFWARFIDDKLLPTATKIAASKGEEQKRAIEEIQEQLKLLETELKEKKFFGGESLGFIDIAANVIDWFAVSQEVTGLEILSEEKLPALLKWHQRLLDNGVYKECLPPRERHLSFIKARFESSTAASQ